MLVFFAPFVALTWVGNIRAAPVLAPPKQTNRGPSGAPDCLPSGLQILVKTIPRDYFFLRARGERPRLHLKDQFFYCELPQWLSGWVRLPEVSGVWIRGAARPSTFCKIAPLMKSYGLADFRLLASGDSRNSFALNCCDFFDDKTLVGMTPDGTKRFHLGGSLHILCQLQFVSRNETFCKP